MINLDTQILQYIQSRRDEKLEKLDKSADKALATTGRADAPSAAIREQYNEKRLKLQKVFEPTTWLDNAAERAFQIKMVTHAAKFTHSDSKASSLNAEYIDPPPNLLGSHSLSSITPDIVGNAASLDVASLLLLEQEGVFFWHQIKDRNGQSLQSFTKDEQQLEAWVSGFRQALLVNKIVSHSLAKQFYFPVEQGSYHIVSPLFPTSLTNEVVKRIQAARFSEEAKAARVSNREKSGSSNDNIWYPNLLCMNFGGSKPQNISLLNSRRGGRAYLLNSAPPIWRDALRLPLQHKHGFWRMYSSRTNHTVNRFRSYLGKVADMPNKAIIKNTRESFVSELVDAFVQLVAELRQLGDPGWSRECQLPLAEQCLLDHLRNDKTIPGNQSSDFDRMLESHAWLDDVADQFGFWLNNRLRRIKKKNGELLDDLGDSEAHVWRQQLDHRIAKLRYEFECLL